MDGENSRPQDSSKIWKSVSKPHSKGLLNGILILCKNLIERVIWSLSRFPLTFKSKYH